MSLGISGAVHYLGYDNGTGDGVLSPAHQRHANLGMPVDDGFDLLGVDLQASDIDDAATPADERPAGSAPLVEH
jgi:hypothetical protein